MASEEAYKAKYQAECAAQSRHGLIGVPSDAIPSSEITIAMDRLQEVINRYDNLVHRLSDRINSVVRPAAPEVCGNEKNTCFQAPLAYGIQCNTSRVTEINNILQDLLERIEL
jgi:hypothetical protein